MHSPRFGRAGSGGPMERQLMKKSTTYLAAFLLGACVALGPASLAGWAHPNPPTPGHGPDHDKEKHKHEKWRGHREHWDNGLHRGWYRDREGYYRFDDDDRVEIEHFYREHRDERWFREPAPRVAFAYGYVLGPRYRRYCHPLPVMMLRELPPPPPHCHYFLYGGNVLLLDDGYRVHDFIQLTFNFGR